MRHLSSCAFPDRDGRGASLVVNQSDAVHDRISAPDGKNSLVAGLGFTFWPSQYETSHLYRVGIFDFNDRLPRMLLNNTAWSDESTSVTSNADLLAELRCSAIWMVGSDRDLTRSQVTARGRIAKCNGTLSCRELRCVHKCSRSRKPFGVCRANHSKAAKPGTKDTHSRCSSANNSFMPSCSLAQASASNCFEAAHALVSPKICRQPLIVWDSRRINS